jgi:hypothetical protein
VVLKLPEGGTCIDREGAARARGGSTRRWGCRRKPTQRSLPKLLEEAGEQATERIEVDGDFCGADSGRGGI